MKNESSPATNLIMETSSDDLKKLWTICHETGFSTPHFPALVCLYLCTPEHFASTGYTKQQLRSMFFSINCHSGADTIESIIRWENSNVKTALLYICGKKIRGYLRDLLSPELEVNSITQLQTMRLLYLKASFRDKMILEYKLLIKPQLERNPLSTIPPRIFRMIKQREQEFRSHLQN